MSLLVNGLALTRIISAADEAKSVRRDVGEQNEAASGITRVTRQTRKADVSFRSALLDDDTAFAWECLLAGEGQVWPFDSSLYGSKGKGPSASVLATLITTHPKFGAKNLNLGATTGSITFSAAALNSFAGYAASTVLTWRYESAAWHHYVVRSDGAKWYDGVRNDAAVTTWLTVNTVSGNVVIANVSGADVEYDDLVVLPFMVLDAWAPVLGVATVAFSLLPYLNVTGTLVREQATRSMIAAKVDDALAKTGSGIRHRLDVELKAR